MSNTIVSAVQNISNNENAPFRTTSSGKVFPNIRFAEHYSENMYSLVNSTNSLNDSHLISAMSEAMTDYKTSQVLHDIFHGLLHEIRVFNGEIPKDPRNKGAINNLIMLSEIFKDSTPLILLPKESTTYIGRGFFTSHRTLQQSFIRVLLAGCITYNKNGMTGACDGMEEIIGVICKQDLNGMMFI